MEIYITDIRSLETQFDAALPLLTAQRREKVLAQHGRSNALRSLAAGLLLRRYVGDGPFPLGEQGKPYQPGGPCFNLSHGGSLAVLAVASAEVGVDVEPRERPYREALLRRVLCPEERLWLAQRPPEDFYRLWTRKEAVLKCRGCGMALRLSDLSVLSPTLRLHDGTEYGLDTVEYHGHILSAALLDGTPIIRVHTAEPADLL